jgi:catalase-peroxidase
MGPISRYLGKEVPSEELIWQDPVPKSKNVEADIDSIKESIKSSDIPLYYFVYAAWASASTFRKTDKRGGANGARILLEPQKSWGCNNQEIILTVVNYLETLQGKNNISIADLIVLAGCAAIEKASDNNVVVPFTSGRTDAFQEKTDIESFKVLEPIADAFRNYIKDGVDIAPEILLVDKANMLNLTPVEMVVLLSGIRMLSRGQLNNGYLVHLLSHNNADKLSGYPRADLVIAANSELRAIAEVYASDDANDKFISDFAKAWDKVMMLDRFDIK